MPAIAACACVVGIAACSHAQAPPTIAAQENTAVPATSPAASSSTPSLDQSLARARVSSKRALLFVEASWCPGCKKLQAELIHTGRLDGMVEPALRTQIDFDEDSSRPMIERYVVLELPCVLVLNPDGSEVGRITGYENAREWISNLDSLLRATDPLPSLRQTAEQHRSDLGAQLALGEALLLRGHAAEGVTLLDQLRANTSAGAKEQRVRSLYLLGRYYQRVRRDYSNAAQVWAELIRDFPNHELTPGAVSWYANAQASLGHAEIGARALKARATREGATSSDILQWAEFVAEKKIEVDRGEAQRLLGAQPVPTDPEEKEERADTLRKLSVGF